MTGCTNLEDEKCINVLDVDRVIVIIINDDGLASQAANYWHASEAAGPGVFTYKKRIQCV